MPNELEPTIPLIADSPWRLQYRDEVLGRLSSHPYWLERGSRILRWCVVGAFTLLYLTLFWVWLRSYSLSDLLSAFANWIVGTGGKVVLCIIAFSIGMLVASAFQLRWAMRQYRDQDLGPGTDAQASSFNLPMMGGIVVIGLLIPLALTLFPGLPAELRVLGSLLALMPVGVLSFLVSTKDDPPVSFPWTGLAVTAVLWIAKVIEHMHSWVSERLPDSFAVFFPLLATDGGTRNALFVLAVSFTIFALFRLTQWMRTHRAAPADAPQQSDTAKEKTDDSLTKVAATLGVACETVVMLAPATDETADWQPNSEFAPFFAGKQLTQDQHKVLTDFCHLADSLATSSFPEGDFTCGFDMLVEGPSGSGRSATLDAIALVGLVVRGTCSVVFVPDEGRVGFAIQRLQYKIALMNLTDFVLAGSLESALRSDQVPPEICVTTVREWEELLVGRNEREGPQFERTRSLMCRYSVVLVDDFLDHPLPVRLHLPFVIDKHRLLLESRMIPSVRVFAFPRMSESGRELASDRLIGHGGIRERARQVCRLRYRRDLVARVFDIDSEHVSETIEQVALNLCQSGLNLVVVRRGIDAEEAARQTEDLRTRSEYSGITVCYCHDQLDALVGDLSAIVMKAADGPEVVFALKSRRPEDDIVIVRIRNAREINPPERITPLIVDRSARGMAETHLQSILRFVDPRVPIPLRVWGQLGTAGRIAVAPANRASVGSLLLDRPEDVSEFYRRDRPYLGKLGAFMALDEPFERYAPVDCEMIPDAGPPWWTDGGDEVFGPNRVRLPSMPVGGNTSNTTVIWKGNDGAELGRTQLHYTDELLLRRRQVFCPDFFEKDGTGGVQIQGMRFRDNGQDGVHPKIEMCWRMRDKTGEETSTLQIPTPATGSPEHGYLWIEHHVSDGCEVVSKLVQRTDDLDRPNPCGDFEFRYRAFVRTLLLAPTKAVLDALSACQAAFAELFASPVEWGTGHPDFMPGLTYSLARALEQELPSTSFMGKILVFRLSGPTAKFASAIVWFVEPQGTGLTLSNAVHELLRGKAYLGELAFRMDQMIAQGWDKSPPFDLARFWLPGNLRRAVLPFERALLWKLAKLRTAKEQGGKPLAAGVVKITCPHCKQEIREDITPRGGLHFLQHCGTIIAMIVPTENAKLTTPRALVNPWWPPEVPIPSGTLAAQTQAVWLLVSRRVIYTKDDYQLEGLNDCWLSPASTWTRKKGDCEDHSILMVAMLRTLGIKCWLTWGDLWAGDEPLCHAWVEAEIDGDLVLLEATRKEPLPEILFPEIDAAGNRIIYSGKYSPHGLFTRPELAPSRTDGTIYDAWIDGKWSPIVLAEPVCGSVEIAE